MTILRMGIPTLLLPWPLKLHSTELVMGRSGRKEPERGCWGALMGENEPESSRSEAIPCSAGVQLCGLAKVPLLRKGH